MREVKKLLVVRVRVNRSHLRRAYPEMLVNHFGYGRKAVGRAGGVRDYVVLARVVCVFIDAEHNRDVFVLGRSGDDHFLDRAAQVLTRIFSFSKTSG